MSAKKKSEPAYVIAPLKWRKVYRRREYVARSVFGTVRIFRTINDKAWSVGGAVGPPNNERRSLKAAQAAAESWYRERLLPALVRVNTQGDGT